MSCAPNEQRARGQRRRVAAAEPFRQPADGGNAGKGDYAANADARGNHAANACSNTSAESDFETNSDSRACAETNRDPDSETNNSAGAYTERYSGSGSYSGACSNTDASQTHARAGARAHDNDNARACRSGARGFG